MKEKAKKLAVSAGAAALAMLISVPSFAQSRDWDRENSNGRTQSSRRNDDDRRDGNSSRGSNRSYRENERVSMDGRISSFSRERDGYRVRLDRDNRSYWVPQSYFRNRERNLRVGLAIRLGGIFRGGSIIVDAVNWPDDRDYGRNDRYDRRSYNDYLRGTVERVDLRTASLLIRDNDSRRVIEVDMRNADRRGRIDLNDLRRGDYVELSGESYRGEFVAYNIESVRTR
jgi:hypothetical protein